MHWLLLRGAPVFWGVPSAGAGLELGHQHIEILGPTLHLPALVNRVDLGDSREGLRTPPSTPRVGYWGVPSPFPTTLQVSRRVQSLLVSGFRTPHCRFRSHSLPGGTGRQRGLGSAGGHPNTPHRGWAWSTHSTEQL